MKRLGNGQVKILPGLFAERMRLNRDYIRELDVRCLLQNYYLEAGEIMDGLQVVEDPGKARLHWGWEAPTCQLRGHFLGHWMSAAARIVRQEQDEELAARIRFVVRELHRLQKLNEEGGSTPGWVAPIPEKYFTILMTGRYIWSPQYTMHKLLMGLTEAYLLLDNEEALTVLKGLAGWYLIWTEKAAERAEKEGGENAVYAGEQAGMLEIWAELYAATKEVCFRTLVERYENNGLFDVLDNDGDPLTDNHANASIPLAHGAARMFETTGDPKWRERTERFWKKAVTERGMFATTGANAGEFWVPPHREAEFLSKTDQEFCTVYNMVRLAWYLYTWTGETVYAVYIERALYNGFLAQQSRVSGMPSYFLPLMTGSRKKWGSKRNDFWCCTGTMVQAQTLYPDLIYTADEENRTLFVSQYIPSEVRADLGGVRITLTQKTGMKNYSNQAFFDEHGGGSVSRWAMQFSADTDRKEACTLALRVPSWCDGTPLVMIGDRTLDADEVKKATDRGYLKLTQVFAGETVSIIFAAKPVFEPLPDEPDLAAILSGPIVLAGLTDKDHALTGASAEAVLKRRMTHTYGTFPWEQDHYVTAGQPENVEFIPLYEVEDEAYTVYFRTRKG
ncbi:MAG: glycoside hydrolase family 127 protein [Lachnospiraceae bacterium]|nr:glycoside hydrolase family 127 protein [Lachnospiraceae bacterium]